MHRLPCRCPAAFSDYQPRYYDVYHDDIALHFCYFQTAVLKDFQFRFDPVPVFVAFISSELFNAPRMSAIGVGGGGGPI